MTTTKPTTKPAAKAVKKPKAPVHKKVSTEKVEATAEHEKTVAPKAEHKVVKHQTLGGRYIFATGRRKTAVANVRLFEGEGEAVVNKIPLKKYFSFSSFQDEID